MSHSYRYYRQVKIVNNSQQSSPQIDGFEKIVRDGKGQVYYWNYPRSSAKWDTDDWLVSAVIDPDNNWFDTEELSAGVRYLNPHEVIIRDLAYPQRKRQHQNSKISEIKTSIQKRITHVIKMAKRLPLAFKAAWRELTEEG
ncbi:hypothetical protein [Crocosphaera sp.]|uniref:hypothetical protein n=1 Tax=Crocosphaera sp. TaxID=2729996 RepID=UPI003F1F9C53|nr:hypothetical protein [Crocosphaera sp.]